MILPPPTSVILAVHQWVPGIWPAFVRAANSALSRGDQVTSWWRSPTKNQEVGGHPASQHLVGLAFDVATPSPHELAAALASVGFTTVQAAGHVHAQTFAAGILDRSGLLFELGLRRL